MRRSVARSVLITCCFAVWPCATSCTALKQAAIDTGDDANAPASIDDGSDKDARAEVEPENDDAELDATGKRTCPPAEDRPSALVYVVNEETVFDTVTGLEWERAARPASSSATFADAKNICAGLRTANHADWRLPTRSELFSIVDYTNEWVKISRVIFLDALSFPTWTSTSSGNTANDKWLVSFQMGDIAPSSDLLNDAGKLSLDPATRCVRQANLPCKQPAKRFVQRGNVVRDEVTGLEWEGGSGGSPRPPAEAVTYCSNLPGADVKRPWRVPSVKEVDSLVVEDAAHGFVDPLFDSSWNEWWTALQALSYGTDVRYLLDLSDGRIVMEEFFLNAPRAVRCVR